MRVGLGVVGAVLLAAGAGALYERVAEARDRRRFPPPGALVEMNGYRLHAIRLGGDVAKGPTVVFDAGLAGFTLDWGLVLPQVAEFASVFAYDRAGYGWSDPAPAPRTASALADELAALLQRAGVPGPYVLVGHSFAGYTSRIFADHHRDQVAGLVLVDPSQEDLYLRLPPDLRPGLLQLDRVARVVLRVGGVLARLGVVRLLGEVLPVLAPFRKLPEPQRTMAFVLRYTPRFFRTSYAEYQTFIVSGEQAGAVEPLGAMPVTVLSAIGSDDDRATGERVGAPGGSLGAVLRAMAQLGADLQGEMAARISTNATHIVTSESGHQIALTQPALVVEAVRRVLAASAAPRHTVVPPGKAGGVELT